ncbi:Serine dehydrogenase proteinase [Candidatus Electrothrix aarhusensis]|uniref:Serine dehydrogenase proteinase n=1 Tax=Candidatus Electrothrix aarhusensis TaxID=1859131 RepID=A0A444J2C2_9BACT|nr:Serine dehydrogenase proteinase [Candidatus Electrothrix aarhusensis]
MKPDNQPTDQYNGEIFLYYGDISREGYSQISALYEERTEKKDKICLILITDGGDPDAAYRIARATNHHFDDVEILIPDICKSAGTLLCIGAQKLIFGDRGELGPLDIQLSKPDEMLERMSGLDIIQAINALQNQTMDAFRSYLVDIRMGTGIHTKTAADIATKLADDFIAPIAARIDPLTLGEHQRAMQIAYDYGERLSNMTKSLQHDALVKLVSGYPSHGFVIDRKEAGSLFENVVAPDNLTENIYWWSRQLLKKITYPKVPIILDVKKEGLLDTKHEQQEDADEIDNQRIEEDGQNINGTTGCKGKNDEPNFDQSNKSKDKSRKSTRK